MKLKFDRNEVAKLVAGTADKKADVTLVKDDGIYIMCFKQPKESRTIVYAKGFDPKKDGEGVWEKSRAAVGGDDFGETCNTVGGLADVLDDSEGDIIVSVTANAISTSYLPKLDEAAKAKRIETLKVWLAKVAPFVSNPTPKLKRSLAKVKKELVQLGVK